MTTQEAKLAEVIGKNIDLMFNLDSGGMCYLAESIGGNAEVFEGRSCFAANFVYENNDILNAGQIYRFDNVQDIPAELSHHSEGTFRIAVSRDAAQEVVDIFLPKDTTPAAKMALEDTKIKYNAISNNLYFLRDTKGLEKYIKMAKLRTPKSAKLVRTIDINYFIGKKGFCWIGDDVELDSRIPLDDSYTQGLFSVASYQLASNGVVVPYPKIVSLRYIKEFPGGLEFAMVNPQDIVNKTVEIYNKKEMEDATIELSRKIFESQEESKKHGWKKFIPFL